MKQESNNAVWDVGVFNCEKCFCQFVSRYVVGFEPRYCQFDYEDSITCTHCKEEFMIQDVEFYNMVLLCKSCALRKGKNA